MFIGWRGIGDEGINRRFCEEVVRYGKLVMLGVIQVICRFDLCGEMENKWTLLITVLTGRIQLEIR